MLKDTLSFPYSVAELSTHTTFFNNGQKVYNGYRKF